MVDTTKISEIIERWDRRSDMVIEMMHDIQSALNHIPREAIEMISSETGVSRSRLYHVGTFYNAFTFTPTGKFHFKVCLGTACHVKGAPKILENLERELNIKEGETSADGNFSIEAVRCVGCCGLAPVVGANEEMHGLLKQTDIKKIVKNYRKQLSS